MKELNNEQKEICRLLQKYIGEYNEKKEMLNGIKANNSLYEELLAYLEMPPENIVENKYFIEMLFSTLYSDSIYLDTLKENRSQLKDIANLINEDYIKNKEQMNSLDEQLKRSKNRFLTAKEVQFRISYGLPIGKPKYEIQNIIDVLSYYQLRGEISKSVLLSLINEIEIYSKKSNTSNDNNDSDANDDSFKKIPDILTVGGWQEHDTIEVDENKKPRLNIIADSIKQAVDSAKNEQYMAVVGKYRAYNIEETEFKYVIVKVLDKLVEDLFDFRCILLDEKIFANIDSRQEIIRDYYETLRKYLKLRSYYELLNKVGEEELEGENEETKQNKNNEINSFNGQEPIRLIYLMNTTNKKEKSDKSEDEKKYKVQLIADMKSAPYEYYEKIKKLLDDFRSGKAVKIATIAGTRGKVKELIDDQIRILYRHVKNNIYIVIGVHVKKTNREENRINLIARRTVPQLDTDRNLEIYLGLAEWVEAELEKLVKEKARRGNR